MLTAKEYLEQIEQTDKLIDNKLLEIYQLRCLATKTTAQLNSEPVQTSGASDKVGKIVAKIVDMEAELNEIIDSFVDDKQQRIAVIEQVKAESFVQYQVLHRHYVEYMPFTEVAKKEGYSYQYILELHQKALENVQKILVNGNVPI